MLTPRLFLNLDGDIGGFGVGSGLIWSASGGLGYQVNDNLAIETYNRVLSVDYEKDGFLFGAELHGIFAGLALLVLSYTQARIQARQRKPESLRRHRTFTSFQSRSQLKKKERPMRNLKITGVLLMATMAATCAWAGQFGDYKPHGFLSDYSKLKPEGGNSEAYKYLDPTADGAKYDKIMIDRIKVYLKDDAKSKEIDPAELKEITDYFHRAIVKSMEGAYPVVREPGPDVLRLRVAITDLVPNKPEASVVTLVVPYVWVAEAGAGAAKGKAGSTPFIGEATVEIEALDSKSSKQLAAYIETRTGKKYNWTHGVDTAAKDYLKAYSTWAYTKQAMDHWAQLIRKRLDAAHGK